MSVPPLATIAGGIAPGALAPVAGDRPTASTAAAGHEARAFERVLLEQLTTQLASTAAPDDASPATAAYRDLLPGAMADALSAAGGLGLTAALGDGPVVGPGRGAAVSDPPATGSPS